jgi:DNA replication and repair protein RecF
VTKIRQLNIKNFRNIEEALIDIKSPLVCFHGQNAQGKTNILEAVYLVSNPRSFRAGTNSDYIKIGSEGCSVFMNVDDDIGEYRAGIKIVKDKKEVYINSKKVKSIKALIKDLKIIAYVPNSYELVLGDDAERRKFIDKFCFYMDQEHMDDLVYYNNALKNRNAALKKKKDYSLWDELMAEKGERIISRRMKELSLIDTYIQDTFKIFFNDTTGVNIKYRPSGGISKKELLLKLKDSRDLDEQRGFTGSGPHRDKLDIIYLNNDAKKFVSTGQAKLIALLLKIAKARAIKSIFGKAPVFLYDDVNAFLDEKRLSQLIEIIKEEDMQILSSSVDNNLFRRLFSDSVQFITVREGRLIND